MEILAKLRDEEYPFTGIKENRSIVRGLVEDEHGNFAFHHLVGNDQFGVRDYYETPGGGVEAGETLEAAFVRECHEELGYDIVVGKAIGEVKDYYNLIGRCNQNHYFFAKRQGPFLGTHLVSQGDKIIHDTIWIPLEEALTLFANMQDTGVGKLVKNRELIVLKRALEMRKTAKK
jgi:8-oxo-dGTP diphosphatase